MTRNNTKYRIDVTCGKCGVTYSMLERILIAIRAKTKNESYVPECKLCRRHKKRKNNYLINSIEHNGDCSIAKANDRPEKCLLCEHDKYSKCLNISSKNNWQGWQILTKEQIREIEKQKLHTKENIHE